MILSSIVIDSDDANKLSDFYQKLLGWEKKVYDHGENGIWITLRSKTESTTRLVFQQIEIIRDLLGQKKMISNNK